MSPDPNSDTRFTKRFVVFLDILGFKTHVDRTGRDPDHFDLIFGVLNNLNDNLDAQLWRHPGLNREITQFSDSMVISWDFKDTTAMIHTFEDLKNLINHLIRFQILVRGGISMGNLVHTEKVLFGPAMIDAYELESKSAIYPRVIFDMSNSGESQSEAFQEAIQELLDRRIISMDIDGFYYVDFFYNIHDHYAIADQSNRLRNHLAILARLIQNGLAAPAASIRKKYEWMRTKYNDMLAYYHITEGNITTREAQHSGGLYFEFQPI